MIFSRITLRLGVFVALAFLATGLHAQTGLEQRLESQFTLTKITADRSDIVTAGSVVVLEKDGVLMTPTTTATPIVNTYKNGKISHGMGDFLTCKWCKGLNGQSNSTGRTFVTGEKFWVTKIEMHDDGVVFSLYSDPYSDVRYYATLKFPFPKGTTTPPPDQLISAIDEVLKPQPPDNNTASGNAPQQQQAPAPPPQQPAQAMAPIAPPPPPTDAAPAQPKTIALGQTKDQVAANFGQPTKIVKLGTKEIDYYPDMKVTFVNNKVTDVQ
jgi:hypothetical protein